MKFGGRRRDVVKSDEKSRYFSAILTAVSSAMRIMVVKVVCRWSAGRSSPVTRWSEMEQMARARLPSFMAVQYRAAASISTASTPISPHLRVVLEAS